MPCYIYRYREKMKNSVRRGLFHPDDIKVFGLNFNLNTSPGPKTAPLPDIAEPRPFDRPTRPSLSPVSRGSASGSSSRTNSLNHNTASPPSLRGHGRSFSFVSTGSGGSGGGSMGRAETRRLQSAAEFGKYTEDDDEDYEDVFGKPNGTASEHPMEALKLNTRLSNRSWLGDEDSDEEDPFAEIDEGFSEDDLEANLQRDKYARLCNQVNSLIDELTPSAPDFQLRDACDQLASIQIYAFINCC
ncbi:hypothetical protein MPER_07763 [Moniliophthora perniciosa FA553]|nr:hypothetical protein MPER_07763 [Moniliophthora perniciosa FA553]